MKGYGDPETWPQCFNDPGDPRTQDNHYTCVVCGEDIWTNQELDDETWPLCHKCWELQNL